MPGNWSHWRSEISPFIKLWSHPAVEIIIFYIIILTSWKKKTSTKWYIWKQNIVWLSLKLLVSNLFDPQLSIIRDIIQFYKWSPTFGKVFSAHKELTTLQGSLVCCYNVQLVLPPVVEEISNFNIFVLQIFEDAFVFSPWQIFYLLDKYTCSLLDHSLDTLHVLHPWLSSEILL